MCGFIMSPKEKQYVLFGRDFRGGSTDYILPMESQYGDCSASEDKRIRDEVRGVSCRDFIDITDNEIFHISDVRFRIAKIDIKTKKIEFMGEQPNNFRQLVMSKKTREELLQPEKKIMQQLLNGYSFITGIFADNDIVGVVYVNRDKRIGDELFFTPFVQIYSHSGQLLCTQHLPEIYSEDKTIYGYYKKETRDLYLLSMLSDENTVNYTVYDYQIEP
jgi:hypothetical protein